MKRLIPCPDCHSQDALTRMAARSLSRRDFVRTAGAVALAGGALPVFSDLSRAAATASEPESIVKLLYGTLSDEQKSTICFGWDHQAGELGLLRTRVANNWHITDPDIISPFYTKDQQAMIRQIFEGIIHPDWHERIYKQLEDDAGGYGTDQNIAIFGTPDSGQFELVMTGRHMTIRCDGNSAEHMAFGGPIFYGHAADGFDEGPAHAGNVFWPQAVGANKLFEMLDGKQRAGALVDKLPTEQAVGFRGTAGGFQGLPLTEMSADQREQVQKVLELLIEPYRVGDREEALACLKAQGGLDKCALAFYKEGDIGGDGVWDCWRLEGPAFVWYFRGTPHVHVWANVAASPDVATNT